MYILKKAWKHKMLSPLLKTFCWRLIRRAIAIGERAGKHSNKISKLCATCNNSENDAHLFFQCTFARAVWFSANPSLCSSLLPNEQDGVQESLAQLINQQTTDEQMMLILTTMWYIWKARNDHRFQNKPWNVWQVHHAVAAGIAANLHQAHQQGNQDHQITLLLGPSTYQGMGLLATGSGADDVHESRHQPMLMQTLPSPPWYRVQLPALFAWHQGSVVPLHFAKFFKISCHIESLDACMKH